MGSESIESKLFPPGFRFHPTDEELILYYLKRKICGRSLKLDIIAELDVYKWDPHELPGQSKWKNGDTQWFFFSPRDRRHPNGGRSNRGTMNGYWKATGKDRTVNCNSRSVGIKKTIVYYQGRAPSGQRTDWVMHEYILHEEELKRCRCTQPCYVLYKLFKKSGPGPKNGEQHGAPFVEEEWVNDVEYLDVEPLLVRNINPLVNEPKQLTSGIEIVPPMTQINPVNIEDVDKQIDIGPNHKLLQVQSGPDMSVNKPSVITSAEEVHPLLVNEDFLEMDDLISSQPLQFADFDGFCDYGLYNGSTTFSEMNPYESQQIQQPYYASNLQYGMESSGYNLWTHDQSNNNFVAAQATEAFTDLQAAEITISAPSGVITDENPGKPDSQVNQYQKTGEVDGLDSWFSSALWAFVESVPTNPASAMESSALVDKGFSKMSNIYGDSRGGVERTSVARRVGRASRSRSRVIVYFSVGVLFAIMYVFLGISVKLLGRCKL